MRRPALKIAFFLAMVALLGGSAYLVFAANQSYRLMEVLIQPKNVTPGVTMFATTSLSLLGDDGIARVELTGAARDPSLTSNLVLRVRPMVESTWYDQACCVVTAGSFSGVVQLGSREWPLHGDSDYEFTLTSTQSGLVLVSGSISARERNVVTTGHWQTLAVGFVGIVSSLAQIGQLFFTFTHRQRSRKSETV